MSIRDTAIFIMSILYSTGKKNNIVRFLNNVNNFWISLIFNCGIGKKKLDLFDRWIVSALTK